MASYGQLIILGYLLSRAYGNISVVTFKTESGTVTMAVEFKYKRGQYLMDIRTKKVWRVKNKKHTASYWSPKQYKLVLVGAERHIQGKQAYCDANLSEREIDSHYVAVTSPEIARILYGKV
jgi:hypothetical protein